MKDMHPVYFRSGAFRVPLAGFYQVSGKVQRGYPTGIYETVENPNRSWWEFWKPAFVQREIWHWVEDNSGVQVVLLKAGDEVQGPATRITI